MSHISDIAELIKTSQHSSQFNSVLIEGPPGWGKSTATEAALEKLNFPYAKLSTYTTPGNLFNFLHDHAEPGKVCVIDDCAGIFNDSISTSILKLATWSHSGGRYLTWGSTNRSAVMPDFEFYGKIVVLVNSLPMTADLEAVRSRCLYHLLRLHPEEASLAVMAAAADESRYSRSDLAIEVASHINSHRTYDNSDALNFRLLAKGYEVAKTSSRWRELMKSSLSESSGAFSRSAEAKKLLRILDEEEPVINNQLAIFTARTGLQRRQFFQLRKDLGLSKRNEPRSC